MSGKGDNQRPIKDQKSFDDTYDKVFGKKPLNIVKKPLKKGK